MGRHCSCNEPAHDTEELSFGEDGELLPAPGSPVLVRPPFFGPCPIGSLNGSWLLEVVPSTIFSPLVRGPMRIEVGPSSLRASGDIYSVRRFFPWRIELIPPVIAPMPNPTPIPTPLPDAGDTSEDFVVFPTPPPWYPSFPKSQYSWYFRSNGVDLRQRCPHHPDRPPSLESRPRRTSCPRTRARSR